MKTTKLFKFDEIKILEGDKSERIFHHKGFRDDKCVDFVSLRFAYVVLPQGSGLDRVNDTDLTTIINKVTNKVVTVVRR